MSSCLGTHVHRGSAINSPGVVREKVSLEDERLTAVAFARVIDTVSAWERSQSGCKHRRAAGSSSKQGVADQHTVGARWHQSRTQQHRLYPQAELCVLERKLGGKNNVLCNSQVDAIESESNYDCVSLAVLV